MNILFDSLGAQVQVQNETGDRLTTWAKALAAAGYTIKYSDYSKPLVGQLGDNKVLIIATRQQMDVPGYPPAIPPSVSFAYDSSDLSGMQTWIREGGSLLLFVNHSASPPFTPTPPNFPIYWPIYDIQLAAALGITTVFAVIGLSIPPLSPGQKPRAIPMAPNLGAPPAIIDGVAAVEAWDSGGIVSVMSHGRGTVLVPLPEGSTDTSGLGHSTKDLAFAVLYTLGKGKIIVIGHSGITGNKDTPEPSWGQIESGDNLRFLMNCVAYLAGSTS
ncbi:MAG TPA: hypothetical protein VGM86_32320 [Thermoanaerobaculia bacterium]|jgi:hypothetical protein